MFYTSTRGNQKIESAQAIACGIASDGGLYVPVSFPKLSITELSDLISCDYQRRATTVLSKFLTDFSNDELAVCVQKAYQNTFDDNNPAPVVELTSGVNILELWHGPTCAFKDLALQLLPFLLTAATKKVAPDKTIVILVATSGDTGKAALEGFADVPNTEIIVFFPCNGVSDMQKLQMTTQYGGNVTVCSVNGNFDDAQSGVKAIFADKEMRQLLAQHNLEFSSANSINFGRLVPQIVYYVSAYCDMVRTRKIEFGDKINVAVPTGNFGNILAAYYAKQMGVPIKKFICASNNNCVLTDFFNTGIYNRKREFFTTISPSMDILISSNLERLLYHLAGSDSALISQWMKELKETGCYKITPELHEQLRQEFYGGFCDELQTKKIIGEMFHKYGYLCDTHTAVALHVQQQYYHSTGDQTPCLVASTASPFKFAPAVLSAVCNETISGSDFEIVEKLSSVTNCQIPEPLAKLRTLPVLHRNNIDKADMHSFIQNTLNLFG